MNFLQRLLRRLGLSHTGRRSFQFDAPLLASLDELARQEQRPPDEIAARLLSQAFKEHKVEEVRLRCWESLSPREKQIAALVCLNNTNPQIAARLVISPQTVKTHVRNILYKFDAHSKQELRQALAHWDFSAWNKA